MAEIIFKNIKKVYDNTVLAVDNFNLTVRDKEFVVLVGPSGCGKSTTLRMAAGLEDITDGELYIDGQLVNDMQPKDRDIAMVFQNYALYPHKTVYANMAFPLKMRHVPKKEIDRIVRAAAETLDITELLSRKPKALSGGQRQRVAIGRAIVRDPKVFLMDEPLSNLDAKLRNQMRSELIKLRKKVDTTFIYVTHDQTEAMTLGDRIVIMKDGVVQQVGTPQEVFLRPENIFVAGFIGTPQMNFFDGELIKNKKTFHLTVGGNPIELPEQIQLSLSKLTEPGGEVTLGVRPHNIEISLEGAAGLPASVDVAEMMGNEVHLHAICCGKEIIICVDTASFLNKSDVSFSQGDRFTISPDPSALHLFDSKSGVRLA